MNEIQKQKLEWLRREIQKGIDDLEAGRFRDGGVYGRNARKAAPSKSRR